VPRLTTVEQAVGELAQRSLHLLCGAIEKNQSAAHETIPVTFLTGESTTQQS
jgi:DNA-binding LacI/PurR family transcriptional regulator